MILLDGTINSWNITGFEDMRVGTKVKVRQKATPDDSNASV